MNKLIEVAMNRIEAELVLKRCNIVDVFSGTIIKGDIAIIDGRIAGIGDYSSSNEKDMSDKYIMPGFIDAHLHIESSMITPFEYAKCVIANGVTTVIADPHEIANVCGIDGIRFMIDNCRSSPLEIHFMVPSCVPATPSEHSGAVIDSENVAKLLKMDNILGLGEMMNYVGVIANDTEIMAKIDSSPIIDGHAPNLSGNALNAYISACVKTDHECTNTSEMLEKISRGMYIQIREGTLSKDLATLCGGINSHTLHSCLFCSDDRCLEDIIEHGTINYSINKAIENGIAPIDAIIIATTNTARCYGLSHLGAIAPGYYADLVVSSSIEHITVEAVYKRGRLVSEDITTAEPIVPQEVLGTVKTPPLTELSFELRPKSTQLTTIKLIPQTIITKKTINEVIIENGVYIKGVAKTLSKVAVVERHGKYGSIGLALVEDYNIKNGAIASTIGHDSHNIIVIGDNDSDMLMAVNSLGTAGGIAIVINGELVNYLKLEIAGLMTAQSAQQVLEQRRAMKQSFIRLGINPELDPLMSLAFLPLPVIPEIRITDSGLFDVNEFKLI